MDIKKDILNYQSNRELSERESSILKKIVQLYILKAAPIGSRFLAKIIGEEISLSPATLRNIMSDLEELEYISHPHTSAGRVPTDKGYRFYVNNLSHYENLSINELIALNENIKNTSLDKENVLQDASKLLGILSKYLSVVKLPQITDMMVERIELVSLSSNRILVVLSLDSNIIRSVTIEVPFDYQIERLDSIKQYINERISGKSLQFIKNNFNELIKDIDLTEQPLVRVFSDSIDKIFISQESSRLLISGTQNLLEYPEFEDLNKIKGVIELIENRDVIIHLLDKKDDISHKDIQIMIGSEMESDLLEDFSFVSTTYKFGSTCGSIGLIGPKRMNYPRMISLVHTASLALSQNLE